MIRKKGELSRGCLGCRYKEAYPECSEYCGIFNAYKAAEDDPLLKKALETLEREIPSLLFG